MFSSWLITKRNECKIMIHSASYHSHLADYILAKSEEGIHTSSLMVVKHKHSSSETASLIVFLFSNNCCEPGFTSTWTQNTKANCGESNRAHVRITSLGEASYSARTQRGVTVDPRCQHNWHPELLIHFKRDVSYWHGREWSCMSVWWRITILNGAFHWGLESVWMVMTEMLVVYFCFEFYYCCGALWTASKQTLGNSVIRTWLVYQ